MHILIEGQKVPQWGHWQFFVSLVRDGGEVRVLSSWRSYDEAILAAGLAARDHRGERTAPLPVHDQVLRPR